MATLLDSPFLEGQYERNKERTVCWRLEEREGVELHVAELSSVISVIFRDMDPPQPGLPRWLSGKGTTCQCRKHRFNLWLGNVPWRRKWQPTSYSCLENPMDRSVVGHSSRGCKRIGDNFSIKQQPSPACCHLGK